MSLKKIAVVSIALLSNFLLYAQPGKQPATKMAASASPLKSLSDSANYAMGMSFANFFKQQGVSKINTAIITKAINDVINNKKPLITDADANAVMNAYLKVLQEKKSKPAIDSGMAFLKKNKTKPGVKTTASGLQYEVLRDSTGAKPTAIDTVVCHYRGTFLNGTVFDESYGRGQPISFSLNGVIPGWTEGLQLMSIGSKYKFYVPYTLGYGASDYMSIPGGSLLIFEIELLDIKKTEVK